jgi:fluoride ion exporter CrcB/FEX
MIDTARHGPTARPEPAANGAALAAFLAAGVGAFAIGLVVLLNEAGIFTAPSLHAGAGGVSGRTTFAAIVWLVAWVALHRQWKDRHIEPGLTYALTLLLVTIGIVATFPPLWRLL